MAARPRPQKMLKVLAAEGLKAADILRLWRQVKKPDYPQGDPAFLFVVARFSNDFYCLFAYFVCISDFFHMIRSEWFAKFLGV